MRIKPREEEHPRCWRVRWPNGSIQGPYTECHIADLLAYNNLSGEAEVAAIDSDDWHPIRAHPKFAALFEGKMRLRLRQSSVEERTQRQEEALDVRDILEENLRIEQQHADGRRTTCVRDRLRILSGIIAYMLLFGFAGVAAAYFVFEQASASGYLLAAMAGAVAGLFYARCKSGSLSNWN
jgi:hypothetical protein